MDKVLYLQWDCFGEEYICDCFKKNGLDVESYSIPYGHTSMRRDEAFEKKLEEHYENGEYLFAFSFNYFPAVALAIYAAGGRYISWTYDSPFMYLYSKTISLPSNISFSFDSYTVDDLKKKGVNNLYYLPMAAPVDRYDRIYSSASERKQYGGDIAFVGSMYTEPRQNWMEKLYDVSDDVWNVLETLMKLQLQSYAMPVLERLLNKDLVSELQKVCPIELGNDEMQTIEWMYANYFLARGTTAVERTNILTNLADKYSVNLFSPADTPGVPGVAHKDPVDYCDGMPHVFKNSKINLNISLKSIYSGIPLRAFDIMGCKGFLISDFQPDFGGLFIPDEDYVFYTTEDDLMKKVDFYLEHEDKRKQIAQSGYEKVKEQHTYDVRVQTMLSYL